MRLFEIEQSKGVVFSFGRLSVPHYGHLGLIHTMAKEAQRRGYDWKLFVSSKQEPEKNPLSYEQKIYWINKLFPITKGHLVVDPSIKNPLTAATYLYGLGFRSAVFVAGDDDIEVYGNMIRNGNEHGRTHQDLLSQGKAFLFNPLDTAISERLTSATSVRKTVAENDPVAFAKAVLGPNYSKTDGSTIHDIETNMFSQVRQGMVKPEKLVKKTK
jgi:hypothetical protein